MRSFPSRTVNPSLLRRRPLAVPAGGDKDARGRTFIVGGAPQMPGAVVLAATAALRAGAGKVQIGACRSIALAVGTEIPEAFVVALDETPSGCIAADAAPVIVERANAADAVVFGPGMVDEPACGALLGALVGGLRTPLIVDAAGLPSLGEHPDLLHSLGARAVVTPHRGEMAAMLGVARGEVEAEPQRFAREAADRLRAVVALKGAQTYITAPDDETVYVNTSGTIGLATSGSGDTLAGIIGGLVARGTPPLDATLWGVYLHARAGQVLAKRVGLGFLARELLAEIPPIMKTL